MPCPPCGLGISNCSRVRGRRVRARYRAAGRTRLTQPGHAAGGDGAFCRAPGLWGPMGSRSRIRWENVAKLGAGGAACVALVAALPGLLRRPEPPPLDPDVGFASATNDPPPPAHHHRDRHPKRGEAGRQPARRPSPHEPRPQHQGASKSVDPGGGRAPKPAAPPQPAGTPTVEVAPVPATAPGPVAPPRPPVPPPPPAPPQPDPPDPPHPSEFGFER
jgi:hypothetical protein